MSISQFLLEHSERNVWRMCDEENLFSANSEQFRMLPFLMRLSTKHINQSLVGF